MSTDFDKETIEKVLLKHYDLKNLKINEITSKPAVAKGENYASNIWRVNVKWETDNQTREDKLIIKSFPEGKMIRDFVVNNNIFQTEAAYYQELVPFYSSLYKKRTGKEIAKFGPTIYQTERKDLIILEDISPAGFRLGNKRQGVDYDHGVLVIKALARHHGLSIAALRENPSLKDHELNSSNFYSDKNKEMMFSLLEDNPKSIAAELENWPNFEPFRGKFRPVIYDEWMRLANSTGKLRVLLQGDCWQNNMLFRYDEESGKVLEVCLLDFQIVHLGPLAFDLMYFFYTRLSPETIVEYRDQLIDLYIQELHQWLETLGEDLDEYTRENLLQDILDEERLGVAVSCSYLPMMMTEAENAPTFDNLEDLNNSELIKTRSSNKYQERLLKVFKHFEQRNILS